MAGGRPRIGAGYERDGPPAGGDGLDRVFTLTIGGCVVVTLLIIASGLHGHAILPALDLVIDTIALVVSGTLTALAWARFRERRLPVAVYQAGAFLALTIAYSIAVIVSLQESATSGSLALPRDVQVLVFAVAGLVAASMFVAPVVPVAAAAGLARPRVILLVAATATLGAQLVGTLLAPPPDALRILVLENADGLAATTPFGALVHLTTGVLFFAGAFASRSLWRRDRAVFDGWIGIGLLFAGFAALNLIPFPRAHPGHLSTADMFLLASFVMFLAGLVSAAVDVLKEVRAANVELVRLRDAEVERAALEERARLARELHDGLAQDLWLAKLRIGELAGMSELSADARRGAAEAMSAIDSGLGDAREAVQALRSTAHVESGFCALVRSHVEDCGDRFGLRAEFAFEGTHTTSIAPRTQAEVLRISQEALTNVARHAQASVVGVRLVVGDRRITLRIADNGQGFDPTTRHDGAYGLLSMRERAGLIGGRLRVVSRPGAGTQVVLTAPFAPPATPVEIAKA